ncbi:hypothetical protein JOF53_001132 [Crossiella equi]|uniref:TFIIB-type zinc ribbon-containing protein n=1 Tax=Crossiella equi TaxID=130796 RepID=A0ABS5A6N9_9PSEU|nr:hypothetical protein [Crossiella equi]MBP2472260.1 hypothetical protein [Crossiella equi]
MSTTTGTGHRFRDTRVRIYQFADQALVRCPACGGCATVLAQLGEPEVRRLRQGGLVTRRRLRCGACGLAKDRFQNWSCFGGPVDPYFRLPLWLQADCRGELLWALNREHLDYLESYVSARLREHEPGHFTLSLVARLPRWLTSAKNRDEVLRVLGRLRATLP